MDGRRTRALGRGMVALCTGLCMLVFAVPAFANAPNPGTTTVDQVTVAPDGSRTVTVEGTWTWVSQSDCPAARNGVGYQVDWFDNTANSIGTSKSPDGVLYVGDAQDNVVHSIEQLGGLSALGNAFWDGVPSSYTAGSNPTATDARNWLSSCDGLNASGITAGTWGPISHTYSSSFTGPIELCPIMYDPHGGHDNSGQSKVQDITAGANASTRQYNADNSYQTNDVGPGPGSCAKVVVPTLTTSASSGTLGQSGGFHDTATLTGSSGAGTISWNVYPAGSGCSGTPLFTDSLSVSGDGTYTNPNDFDPTSTGKYQWQSGYSSSTIKNLLSNCNDANEQTTVTKAQPAITTAVTSSTATVGDTIQDTATLTGGHHPTGTITWDLYSNASCTDLVDTVTVSVNHGNGTYVASPGFTTSKADTYYWAASYSGDANNQAATPAKSCGHDPLEQTTVSNAPVPKIALQKLEEIGSTGFVHGPLHGPVGATVDYQMTVTNTGNTPLVIRFTDHQCDTNTLSGPTVKAGSYNAIKATLSVGGVLQYTCSHVLNRDDQPYTNKADVTGTSPSGQKVYAHDQVDAYADAPGIRVVKLERDASTGGPFTVGPITITEHAGSYVVHTIQYEILVTNTGNTPLTLSLNDPRCDSGTVAGPARISGTLNGDVLAPGAEAQYTCSHQLLRSDSTPFTNTATVTGKPPVGPPVHGTSKVTVKKQTVAAKKICRTQSGRVIHYTGHRKPAACRFHPKHPKRPNGFTG